MVIGTLLIFGGCKLPDSYTVVSTPTFSPPGGTYDSAQSVTIDCATLGASIRYTTDGSTPTSSYGGLYSGPVSVSSATTLQAVAYEAGMIDSEVASAVYTLLIPGELDTSFLASGTGMDASVSFIVLQSDGEILIGGTFSTYNGISRSRLARIRD